MKDKLRIPFVGKTGETPQNSYNPIYNIAKTPKIMKITAHTKTTLGCYYDTTEGNPLEILPSSPGCGGHIV